MHLAPASEKPVSNTPDDSDAKKPDDGAPGSDDPPRTKETDALIYHPRVVRAAAAVLHRRGMRWENMEDAIADVLLRAWAIPGPPPTTIDGWLRRVQAVANKEGIDKARKEISKGGVLLPMTDKVAETQADPESLASRMHPIDRARLRELLEELRKSGKLTELGAKIVEGVQDGTSQADIARELGVTHQKVRHEWMGVRKLLKEHPSASTLVAALMIAVLFLVIRNQPEPVAHHDVPDAAPPVPSAPAPQVLVDTHRAEIEKLREGAAVEAKARHWQACVKIFVTIDDLQRATDASTTTDAGPDTLRDECERGYIRSLDSKGGLETPPTAPKKKKK
jgi:DNA-directed RNA polymerase specialized sigma24 family protein